MSDRKRERCEGVSMSGVRKARQEREIGGYRRGEAEGYGEGGWGEGG